MATTTSYNVAKGVHHDGVVGLKKKKKNVGERGGQSQTWFAMFTWGVLVNKTQTLAHRH